jgi:hypothetical protein
VTGNGKRHEASQPSNNCQRITLEQAQMKDFDWLAKEANVGLMLMRAVNILVNIVSSCRCHASLIAIDIQPKVNVTFFFVVVTLHLQF